MAKSVNACFRPFLSSAGPVTTPRTSVTTSIQQNPSVEAKSKRFPLVHSASKMIFFQSQIPRGLFILAFVLEGAAKYDRLEARLHGRAQDADNLRLRIASEEPINSTVEALDCVTEAADHALNRNTRMNSRVGAVDMTDADAIAEGEASERPSLFKPHTDW